MTKKNTFIFALGLIFALAFLYFLANRAKEEYLQSNKELLKYEEEAKSLALLKRKFKKSEDERVIKSLTLISPSSKDYKKSDSRVLVFDDLKASALASMLRRIENSTLRVKSLEIKRNSPDSATLELEISK